MGSSIYLERNGTWRECMGNKWLQMGGGGGGGGGGGTIIGIISQMICLIAIGNVDWGEGGGGEEII